MQAVRPWVFALALALGCTAEPEPDVLVVATRELGPITTAQGVTLREQGYSLYGFSRSLWLFGATHLAKPDAQGSSVRASSWSHTLDLVGEDGIAHFITPLDDHGGPAELFTPTAEELAFNQASPDVRMVIRPLAGVRDDQHERVLLFYAKLRETKSGAVPIGSSLAVWTSLEFGPVRPVLDAGSDEPTLLFLDPEPRFGQAALINGEHVYAFGCEDALYHPCKLARVELAAVFERSAWQYWTGREWSSDLADAVSTVEAAQVFSVHYNPHVQRYLAFYGEREAGAIMLRTATAPEGPWSSPVRVLTTDAAITDVIAHGEHRRRAGRFEYLSYRVTDELRLLEVELAAKH